MPKKTNFEGYSIVSCGTMRAELNSLKQEGFLNADQILYTKPGLHEVPRDLEESLKKQIGNAQKYSQKIIVVYGEKCYIDTDNASRDIDTLIRETGADAGRINVKNCVDMVAGSDERERISGGQRIYWLSPGWLEYWKIIFRDWDRGKANETFPRHDKAILLDPVGIFAQYSNYHPEKLLEFADWMKLSIEPYSVSLHRLRSVLLDEINQERRVKNGN
jgi:hypothetical protein